MSGFRADADGLKFRKNRILRNPIHRRALTFGLFDIVQIGIEDERKLACRQKAGQNGQAGVKLEFLGAEFFHVGQAFFFSHALDLPGKPLGLGMIHADLALPFRIQQIFIGLGHFVALHHARVVADHIRHHVDRRPISVGIEKRFLDIFHFGRNILGKQVLSFEKISLGLGGLNDIEIILAGLRLGHDLGQQAFADGAKHAGWMNGYLALKASFSFCAWSTVIEV